MAIILDGTSGITTPGEINSANLTFSGTGQRITGDFSNATVANRVAIQSSTTNGNTLLELIPNGTGTISGVVCEDNASFATGNGSYVVFGMLAGSQAYIASSIRGSGTFLPLSFQIGGSERLRIDTSGSIGIGTSSPNFGGNTVALAVNGSSSSALNLKVADVGAFTASSGSGYTALADGRASTVMLFSLGGSERMRIDSSGNVGIGTSSPVQRLQVQATKGNTDNDSIGQMAVVDNTAFNSSPIAGIQFGIKYNTAGAIATGTSIQGFKENATDGNFAQALRFVTQSNGDSPRERMRITSTGDLLLGTNVAPGNFNKEIAINAGAGAISGISFRNTAYTGSYVYQNNTSMYVQNLSGGTVYVIPTSNGVYLTNGATSWTANSDERLKDIIEPISNAANKVSSIRAVIGKYKTDEEGTRRSFLIAQDVQAVLPEAVNVKDDEQGTLGVQYTDVIPLLVAAIKEQQVMIEELKAKVAALEAK